MPRIRTTKPTHWADKKLSEISLQAHLLWIASWNFSDDDGVFEGDPLLLKSQIFPRRLDVRVEQIKSWLDQLVKARFLIPFEYKNEGYYVSRTFKTHQRIDKPQPGIIPLEVLENVFAEHYQNDPRTLLPVEESIVEDSIVSESEQIDFSFFWDLYDKKVGDREKLKKKWDALTSEDHARILEHVPKYKKAQPDKKFRKDPSTFLNNKSWNDEIINGNHETIKPSNGKKFISHLETYPEDDKW